MKDLRSVTVLAWSSELETILEQLRSETILFALPMLCVTGCALGISTWFQDRVLGVALGLAFYFLAFMLWILRKQNTLASAWALTIGCLCLVWLTAVWSDSEAVFLLLILPIGLAAISVGVNAGAIIAGICTVILIFTPSDLILVTVAVRFATVIGIWSMLAILWLTLRSLLAASVWAWSSYETSRDLLERARDTQVQLKQTLEDLANANLQLTRVNQLADGLRRVAEDARRTKQEFVANVSHELRTPLNMIIGFTEMIVNAPNTYGSRIPPALLSDLTVILRNSQHLLGLINDVLDLSQIEAGQMALTREHISLVEVIHEAIRAVQPLFDSRGLYLRAELPDGLPSVFADRTRVREVVLNLLSNAGRFTEVGGVTVRVKQIMDELQVSVTDTGPGISPENLDKIFKPFQQLDSSIRRRHGGSGLGLAISKSFVEQHGGKMWFESTLEVGATFFFTLPIELPAPASSGPLRGINPEWVFRERTRPSRVPPVLARPRIIVCEAGDALGQLFVRHLESVEVIVVPSIDIALQELTKAPAQAVVINVASFDEVSDCFAAIAGLPNGTPVILCSVPGIPDAVGTLGIANYLVKPVSRESLLAAMERLDARGKTVLIVDDEPDALRLFWRMLASAERGYRVLTAANGQEALALLKEKHPDVLLLDLVMPEMDGFQLLAAKNADPELCNIPVIVLSARDPLGKPIVSSFLAATLGSGLSLQQLIKAIESLTRVLSPIPSPVDPKVSETLLA